ncbi:organic solute transporter Ost alpha [Nitzschia inconspicua]|uniref:Organic solute transporter Ost alpha n=1 Tax=Nitzschia inconspicua TaxID=303405 RepID=A0A9K3M6Q0_9STRA|nr:organic solute transporter Ost alpha [Nitzschia inconspicua]
MYDSIDDESAPLSPRDDDSSVAIRSKKKKTTFEPPSGLMVNRIIVIVALAGLVVVSIYLNSFQKQTTKQLSTDEEKIHNLEKTIQIQERIIERFNESVTNTDVLKKLNAMEKEWNDERIDLLKQLTDTRNDVAKELNSTMITLDATVHKAELEIQEQVDSVKADFEQYVLHTEDQFSMENSFMVYQLAGTFTLLSCLISMWHMGSHMRKMLQPAIQRKILAILWMCPIYAITSWLSLVFPSSAGYLAIIKDGYEAYIIYQFLSFCISVLGKGDRNKVVDLLSKQVDHLTPPFRLFPCCCKPHYEDDRALADAILTQCQAFAMQFVFWRPATTIANFLLNKYHYYGLADNPHDYRAPQFYITLIQNLSIFTAFAGLLKFYHAVDKDLEWCRPFAKFLCIKGVVFMTFWQGLALTVLAETTDMGGGGNSDQWAESAQNFLICLEMLLFSIAHFYCFPVEEWQPGYQANYQKAKFGETLALNDFFTDLKLVMSSTSSSKSKKKKHARRSSEPTVIEEGEEKGNEGVENSENGDNLTSKSSTEEGNDEDDDEENVKQALVKALVDSVEEFEGKDDTEIEAGNDVADAQERIGAMLDAMLFLTPQKAETRKPSEETPGDIENETDEDFADLEAVSHESTGLLHRSPAKSVEQALRPSIFTTIAAHMDKEKEDGLDEEGVAPKAGNEDEWSDL